MKMMKIKIMMILNKYGGKIKKFMVRKYYSHNNNFSLVRNRMMLKKRVIGMCIGMRY